MNKRFSKQRENLFDLLIAPQQRCCFEKRMSVLLNSFDTTQHIAEEDSHTGVSNGCEIPPVGETCSLIGE